MRNFKDKIITFLIVVPLLLITLTLIMFFDIPHLPASMRNPVRVIWTILAIALALFIRLGLWAYKPKSMKGQFGGVRWVADIKYDESGNAVDAEINWLCPKHKIPLQYKDCEISDNSYTSLFCTICNKTYDIKLTDATISPQEAQIAVKQDILTEIEI
jgi:hypothetical protein